MLATLEVQKAIYEKLTSYGLAVYDTLPINTPLPYVQMTGIRIRDVHTKSMRRQIYTVSLTAWCIDTTSINIHTMCNTVLQLADEELLLDGEYSHDSTRLEYINFIKEEYNTEILNQAILEFEIEVSKN